MEAFAVYLLKSALWLTGFAVIYFLFLRNERYFMLKRIYLIVGILASFLFPLISFHYMVELSAPQVTMQGFMEFANPVTAPGQPAISVSFNYRMIFLFIYLAGIIYLILRAIGNFTGLFRAIRGSAVTERGAVRIIKATQFRSSFSFFRYVFINPSIGEEEAEEIMNHEIVHVRQRHWFDLLLVEILRMVQWVNPVAWIYTGYIRLNHEYLADQAALQRSVSPANYRAALMNQLFDSPVISLSNSLNYSLNKKRFDMMKQKITSPWRKTKVLFILPVIALLLYAFATPRYVYSEKRDTPAITTPSTSVLSAADQQDTTKPKAPLKTTRKFAPPPPPPPPPANRAQQTQEPKTVIVGPQFVTDRIVFFNGKLVNRPVNGIIDSLGHQYGTIKRLTPDEGLKKYGEKGMDGGYEILTRKQAIEMGLHPPYPRISPEDYPTFNNETRSSFNDWVISQLKYPAEAADKGIKGRVSVSLQIAVDGSVTDAKVLGNPDPLIGNAVLNVVKSSPKWGPPKNPEAAKEPYPVMLQLKFTPPDKIEESDVYVVVEEMPVYPGSESALLAFIKENTIYPEAAKAQAIQGRVIIRFIINKEGNTEDVFVMKGANPLLDAEAVRVGGLLKGFKPGMQGGKAVETYYMVPITFSLSEQKPIFSGNSEVEILKFLTKNTTYPPEAINASDTGEVYVIVKVGKGGIIKTLGVVNDIKASTLPVMKEVVIVGYKVSGQNHDVSGNKKVSSVYHEALQTECKRIANKLSELNLPEWEENDVDFVLAFKFILK